MLRMVRSADRRVSLFAQNLLAGDSSPASQIGRLHSFVRDSIANEEDPPGLEWVQDPAVTLWQSPAGDCDDKAVLLASLLRGMGFQVRLVLIGTNPRKPRQLSHVYVEVLHAGRWVPLDGKVPDALPGWAYPCPTRVERVAI